MSDEHNDFETELRERLARNAELDRQREQARAAFEEFEARREADAVQRERDLEDSRRDAHGQLAARLRNVAEQLKRMSVEDFVVRLGWTASGEEFIAKISTRRMQPARSLLVELDRDDDEVLIRWHSDVGNSLGLWRLLEVEPRMIEDLVLQVADQDLWRDRSSPPPFPSPSQPHTSS